MVAICIVLTQVIDGHQGYTYTLGVFGVALGEQYSWLFYFQVALAGGREKKEKFGEVEANHISC
jgi:hypothetical protein